MNPLHIAHGSSATQRLAAAEIPGDYLAWDDILYEGPIPAGLNLSMLSDVRARYIAAQGWGDEAEIRQQFHRRDRVLDEAQAQSREIVFWSTFELTDQWQLAQILDWVSHHRPSGIPVASVINLSGYFSDQTRTDLRNGFLAREPFSVGAIAVGEQMFEAIRSDEPRRLAAIRSDAPADLPFMTDAANRYLMEYPAPDNGLNLTQQIALEALAAKSLSPSQLFRASREKERAAFMGDWSFFRVLDQMINCHHPLVQTKESRPFTHPPHVEPDSERFQSQVLELTETGRDVLNGKADHVTLNGIDRWLGGVHLRSDNDWRYDRQTRKLSFHG